MKLFIFNEMPECMNKEHCIVVCKTEQNHRQLVKLQNKALDNFTNITKHATCIFLIHLEFSYLLTSRPEKMSHIIHSFLTFFWVWFLLRNIQKTLNIKNTDISTSRYNIIFPVQKSNMYFIVFETLINQNSFMTNIQ